MRTYIYTETPCSGGSGDVIISVSRMIRNRPVPVGNVRRNPSYWYGAHGEAVRIINEVDGIPFGRDRNGNVDRNRLRFELYPHEKYEDHGHDPRAVRIFGV